jgi:hypothetical protein
MDPGVQRDLEDGLSGGAKVINDIDIRQVDLAPKDRTPHGPGLSVRTANKLLNSGSEAWS